MDSNRWDVFVTCADRDAAQARLLVDALASRCAVYLASAQASEVEWRAALEHSGLVVVLVSQTDGGVAFDEVKVQAALDAGAPARMVPVFLGPQAECRRQLPFALAFRPGLQVGSLDVEGPEEGIGGDEITASLLALTPSTAESTTASTTASTTTSAPPIEPDGWLPCVFHPLPGVERFVDRERPLRDLDAWMAEPDSPVRVAAVVARPGEGKSALLERWVATQAGAAALDGGLFVWNFAQDSRAEEFFAEALSYFAAEARRERSGGLRSRLQQVLGDGRAHLLVLDGLEAVLTADGGSIEDASLRIFLRALAGGWVGRSRVLTSGEAPLADLAPWRGRTYLEYRLPPLSQDGAASVLRGGGLDAEPARLGELAVRCGHHALTASLLGALLAGDDALVTQLPAQGSPLGWVVETTLRTLSPVQQGIMLRLSVLPYGATRAQLRVLADHPQVAGPLYGVEESALDQALDALQRRGLLMSVQRGFEPAWVAHSLVRHGLRRHLDVAPEAIHRALRSRLATTLSLRPGELPRDHAALDQIERLVELTRLSGQHREAFAIYRASMGGWEHLGLELSEFSRVDRILSSLCEGGDPHKVSPQLHWSEASLLLTELGQARAALGDLQASIACHEHANQLDAAFNPDYRQRQLDRSLDHRYLAHASLLSGQLADAESHARAALKALRGAERVDVDQARDAKIVPLFRSVETVEREIPIERRDPRVSAAVGDRHVALGAGRLPVLAPDSSIHAEHLRELQAWARIPWSLVAVRLDDLQALRGQLDPLWAGAVLPGLRQGASGALIGLMLLNGEPELATLISTVFGVGPGADDTDADVRLGLDLLHIAGLDRDPGPRGGQSYQATGRALLAADGGLLVDLVRGLVAAGDAAPDAVSIEPHLVSKAGLARVLPSFPEGLPGVGVVRHFDAIWQKTDPVMQVVTLSSCIDGALQPSGVWPVEDRLATELVVQPAADGVLRLWAALPDDRRAQVQRHVGALDRSNRRWLAAYDLFEAVVERESHESQAPDPTATVVHRARRDAPAPELEEILGTVAFMRGDLRVAAAHFEVVKRALWAWRGPDPDLPEGLGVLFAETRLIAGDRVGAREFAEVGVDPLSRALDEVDGDGAEARCAGENLQFRARLVVGLASVERRPQHARRILDAVREWAVEAGHVEGIVRCHALAAELALSGEHLERAEIEAAVGRDLAISAGFGLLAVDASCLLARVRLARRACDGARAVAEQSARHAEAAGYLWGQADALHLVGVAARMQGDREGASKALSRAEELRVRLQHPGLAETRRALSEL